MLPSSNQPKCHQRAFTLIEMLVVLIIVAMVATVIMQGFGYALGVYQRVVKTQNNAYQQAFFYRWFSESLQVQIAKRPGDRALKGTSSALSTHSFRPLLGGQGVKTLVQWELQLAPDGVALIYLESGKSFTVYQWPNATAKFEYLNDLGTWVDKWPVDKSEAEPLPKALRILVNTSTQETLNYVVKVETRLRAEVTMEEILYDRD